MVDNGSSDETADVVRQARVRNAQVKYILEARPGQARARNRGIAEAAGGAFALKVDRASELSAALDAGLRAVRDDGRAAVLDVWLAHL